MTGNSLFVGCWVMSEDSNVKVRVQIDNEEPVFSNIITKSEK